MGLSLWCLGRAGVPQTFPSVWGPAGRRGPWDEGQGRAGRGILQWRIALCSEPGKGEMQTRGRKHTGVRND